MESGGIKHLLPSASVVFGQGGALPMEQPRPDETLRDFVERRERELTLQIGALKSQIAPKETELAEIRRTKAALGMLDPGIAAELSKPNEQDELTETYRALGLAIATVEPAKMKIKSRSKNLLSRMNQL
jgi:hypothetical protein